MIKKLYYFGSSKIFGQDLVWKVYKIYDR